MSRRKKRANNKYRDAVDEFYGSKVKPPTRKIRRNGITYEKTTELHDALVSFGGDDRTNRLTDREFVGQFAQEMEYLGRLGASHLRDTVDSFCDLCSSLYDMFIK